MRRLMLLRHAKSDWSTADQRDHDRPLADRGREAAPRVGRYMQANKLLPDLVICSTALRTRETLSLVAQSFEREPRTKFDGRLYEAEPDVILKLAAETAANVRVLLLIGHNPGFHDLANLLVPKGGGKTRRALREKFPTAALAVIDCDIERWRDLGPQSGSLERFVTPRTIDE